MAKVDSHQVRVKFVHGNAISLDLRGCGSIYLEPNREYFFENAPMAFINYLVQLRRVGITYRLTSDKKGCYMTLDLTGYLTNEPKTILGQLRSNLVQQPAKITRHTGIKDKAVDESVAEDLIPEGTFKEEINTIEIDTSVIKDETPVSAPVDVTVSTNIEVPVTTEINEPEKEEIKITAEEVDALNKTKLIELANSLNIPNVSEIWTKKELRTAIKEKLAL